MTPEQLKEHAQAAASKLGNANFNNGQRRLGAVCHRKMKNATQPLPAQRRNPENLTARQSHCLACRSREFHGRDPGQDARCPRPLPD
jgi:hypothetical protein